MTLDRDIRLSPEEITYTQAALRRRKRQLGRSIADADEHRRAGATIQLGTYERHVDELAAIGRVLDALEEARKDVQRQIRDRLNLPTTPTSKENTDGS